MTTFGDYVFYAVALIILMVAVIDFIDLWRKRPLVIWDCRQERWRAARVVQREMGHKPLS